jgi:hypothetical protein
MHGTRNSLRTVSEGFNGDALSFHYICTGLFLIPIIIQTIYLSPKIWADVFWIAASVFAVQAVRFFLDRGDNSGKNSAIYEKYFSVIRHFMDAMADFSVILLAIIAVDRNDIVEIFVAAFFSLMVIAKEFKYRLWDYYKKRKKFRTRSAHGSSSEEVGEDLGEVMRFSQWFKSAVYICISFSMLFNLCGVFNIKIRGEISHGHETIHYLDALNFGVRWWQSMGDTDFPPAQVLGLGVLASGFVMVFAATKIGQKI